MSFLAGFYHVDTVTILLCHRRRADRSSERACSVELGWLRWPAALAGRRPPLRRDAHYAGVAVGALGLLALCYAGFAPPGAIIVARG